MFPSNADTGELRAQGEEAEETRGVYIFYIYIYIYIYTHIAPDFPEVTAPVE